MTSLRSSRGMTLVEVLVVFVLLAFLAGAALTIMNIHNRELNLVAVRGRMQMCSETMIEQIGRDVHAGAHVLAVGETWSSSTTYSSLALSEMRIVNDTGGLARSYRISGNKLQVCDPGGAYANFNIGSTDIDVATASPFTISADRENVSVQLSLSTTFKNSQYQIPASGGSFRCRN